MKKADLLLLKDIHKNETAIFFGSGPSINKFDFESITNEIIVGVNETILLPIQLDYLFVRDFANSRVEALKKELNKYEAKKKKFVGVDNRPNHGGSIKGAYYYKTITKKNKKDIQPLTLDLAKKDIAIWGSTSFDVMQFLFWMGFKKIYLVGHDCNYSNGTIGVSSKLGGVTQKIINQWIALRKWKEENYSEVEIFLINPVSLKTDVFPEGKIIKKTNH